MAEPVAGAPARAPKSSTEREVKLGAWPGFQMPDLTGVADWVAHVERADRKLDATYYDAADLRLVRSNVTLRHRTGEGDEAGRWTLKLPGRSEGMALDRTEIDVDAGPDDMPDEVARAVSGLLRRAPLEPVARLQTERRALVLLDGGGRKLAEVADDEVTVLDGERVAARFRELEVEAAGGAPDDLLELVVAALRAAGAGQPDPTPKLVRALGPRALIPPDPSPAPLGDSPSMAAVVQHAIAAATQRLLAHDPILRLDLGRTGVHQARVSTRRLRSDLRTFEVVVDPEWAESLRAELKWLADALGSVRDVDVLGIRFRRQLGEMEPADTLAGKALLRQLADQRAERLERLQRTVDSDRYFDLVDRMVAAAHEPAFLPDAERPAAEVLAEVVAKPWHKLRKAANALGKEASDEELHALRIKAKKARYAAEAAARAIPRAEPFATAVAALQDVLGEQHDAVVAEQWLRGAVTDATRPNAAFIAGLLIGAQRQEAAEGRTAWRTVWKELSDKKLRTWMGRHG